MKVPSSLVAFAAVCISPAIPVRSLPENISCVMAKAGYHINIKFNQEANSITGDSGYEMNNVPPVTLVPGFTDGCLAFGSKRGPQNLTIQLGIKGSLSAVLAKDRSFVVYSGELIKTTPLVVAETEAGICVQADFSQATTPSYASIIAEKDGGVQIINTASSSSKWNLVSAERGGVVSILDAKPEVKMCEGEKEGIIYAPSNSCEQTSHKTEVRSSDGPNICSGGGSGGDSGDGSGGHTSAASSTYTTSTSLVVCSLTALARLARS